MEKHANFDDDFELWDRHGDILGYVSGKSPKNSRNKFVSSIKSPRRLLRSSKKSFKNATFEDDFDFERMHNPRFNQLRRKHSANIHKKKQYYDIPYGEENIIKQFSPKSGKFFYIDVDNGGAFVDPYGQPVSSNHLYSPDRIHEFSPNHHLKLGSGMLFGRRRRRSRRRSRKI